MPLDATNFDLAKLLDPTMAHLVPQNEAKSLVNDKVMTRVWAMKPPVALEACVEALLARRIEEDPVIDFKKFPGIWRIQRVRHSIDLKAQCGELFEIMALGLITQIAELEEGYDSTEPVDRDPDVRLVRVTVYPQTDTGPAPLNSAYEMLVRRWPYVDPDQTETLMAALRAVKLLQNPVASGDVYPGVYKVGKVWAEPNDDGSNQIIMEAYQNLATNITEPYTVNMEEDMVLIYKEGMSKTELDAFLVAYQRTPHCPTTGGDPAAGYTAGLHNSIQVGFDTTTGLYSISIKQEVFYNTSTRVTSQDPSGASGSSDSGGVIDVGGGGGVISGESGSPAGFKEMYLHEEKDGDYKTYRAEYNHDPVEPMITAEDITNYDQITLEKHWDAVGLWQGYKTCKQDLSGDLTDWPERIVGFTIWIGGLPAYIIVFQKYFANTGAAIQGAMQYAGGVSAPSYTSGISAEVFNACDGNYVEGWVVVGGAAGHRTGVTPASKILVEATRVQRYLPGGVMP